MTYPSLTIEYHQVEVVKQTLEEVMDDNKDYLWWLANQYGGEEGGHYAEDQLRNYLSMELSFVPPTGAKILLPVVALGKGSIHFYPYTTDVKFGKGKDPINLVFYGNGGATIVEERMQTVLYPPWERAIGRTQYVWIDNTTHGASVPEWMKMHVSLSPDGILGILSGRRHLRLFNSAYPDTHYPGYGNYSLGAVHKDNFFSHIPLPFLGRPLDFDQAQKDVEIAFRTLGYNTAMQVLQPSGEVINGVQHDGLASVIELT